MDFPISFRNSMHIKTLVDLEMMLLLYSDFYTVNPLKPSIFMGHKQKLQNQSRASDLVLLCLLTECVFAYRMRLELKLTTQQHLNLKNEFANLISGREDNFRVILLPSADSFKKGCCQLQAKVCTRIIG